MKSRSIHVRLPPKVFEEAQEIVEEGVFTSLNELVKESVRNAVDEHRKKKALETLAKHYGSVKTKQLSETEKTEILKQFLTEKNSGRDIIKELGL
jgi:Arc/MetJ-type ribon-helix-helix transcriptional regulator